FLGLICRLSSWVFPEDFTHFGGGAEELCFHTAGSQTEDLCDFDQRHFFSEAQQKDSALLWGNRVERLPDLIEFFPGQKSRFGRGLRRFQRRIALDLLV